MTEDRNIQESGLHVSARGVLPIEPLSFFIPAGTTLFSGDAFTIKTSIFILPGKQTDESGEQLRKSSAVYQVATDSAIVSDDPSARFARELACHTLNQAVASSRCNGVQAVEQNQKSAKKHGLASGSRGEMPFYTGLLFNEASVLCS